MAKLSKVMLYSTKSFNFCSKGKSILKPTDFIKFASFLHLAAPALAARIMPPPPPLTTQKPFSTHKLANFLAS